MRPLHITFSNALREARFTGRTRPVLEFRQALFRTDDPAWQRRLYPAALVVTTSALDAQGRTLAVDHQSMRFGLLYNATWPQPLFLRIRNWPYRPLELRPGAPVHSYLVEMRLRDLRMDDGEVVELVVLG